MAAASSLVLIMCRVAPAPGMAKWQVMPRGTLGTRTETTCPGRTPALVTALASCLASVWERGTEEGVERSVRAVETRDRREGDRR